VGLLGGTGVADVGGGVGGSGFGGQYPYPVVGGDLGGGGGLLAFVD